MLNKDIFNHEPIEVAKKLIGKILCHKVDGIWLKAMIIETEAYYANEPGSHASKGRTKSKEAFYMPAGTIYMYYSRGSDSIGFSTLGDGNSVLIKSGIPFLEGEIGSEMLSKMHELNPINGRKREDNLLCSGQTLICKSLGLKVKDWNKKNLDENNLKIMDIGYSPKPLVACRRLGIPENRNYKLLHRVFDAKYSKSITEDPRTLNAVEGLDYEYL
jgi:DNA-3-methyladenine glycosylase